MGDPVIRGCLDRIRRGDVSAAGVLADYLEENGLPEAKRVRKAWDRATRHIDWWQTTQKDFSRRRYTRWEAVVSWRRWLRGEVQKIFQRRWRRLPPERYK